MSLVSQIAKDSRLEHPQQSLWTEAQMESSSLPTHDRESDRFWQHAVLYVPPVVALFGLALNLCVLVFMPRRAVRVSCMAKFYYLVSVVGDILIMLKILAVFTIQATCKYRVVCFCEALGGHQIPWKVLFNLYYFS